VEVFVPVKEEKDLADSQLLKEIEMIEGEADKDI